jgi:hypothetical protein
MLHVCASIAHEKNPEKTQKCGIGRRRLLLRRPPLRNFSTRTTAPGHLYAIVRVDAGTILDKGAYMVFLVNSGMHAYE